MADIIIDVETRANLRPLGEGLSAATAKASEFEKSINAANARVLAFGASAGLIYKIGEAFTGLVKSTIEVEKSLTDVNTLLGKSQSELANFGAELFSVAKQTSQSFATVAEAAKELARQGLTSEQTLERTSEAMNLMRLSGLDASSSVETLTAVLNTFSQAGLNATSVVEKMAAVDAKFAVSSNQLAEGLKRSSAAAVDAGVSYEELLGVITVVQERTARGGAVIGNAFKTIFTKLGRPEVLDDLQNLGIKVRDIQGEILPSIQILKNLASSYESLGPASRSFISEQIAGIYQIGTLKALMADLSKENSRFAETQLVAADSSGSTAKRVAELNTTLDAYINRLGTAAKAFAAAFGAAGFNQGLKDLVGFGTSVLESLTPDPSKSEEIGNKIGVGIMKGLGGFLTGPGLLGAGFIGGKILVKFFSDAAQAAHSLASIGNIINKELQQRQSLETAIALHLQKQPGYIDQIRNGTLNVSTAQDQILLKLKQEEVLRQKILAVSSAMAPGLIAGGVGTTPRGGLGLGTKSKGHIPQFARREEISGAIEGGYMPGQVVRSPVGGVMNTAESLKYASGFTQPFINPPKDSKAGRAHRAKALGKTGIDPYSAGGFVPNYALTGYRGVTPGVGDVNRGFNSIGIQHQLVAALGLGNYTNNPQIAQAYGKEIKKKKIDGDKLLNLGKYNDIMGLYQQYVPEFASKIKGAKENERLGIIQQAGKALTKKLVSEGYSGVRSPLGGGDKKFFGDQGLSGDLLIPFSGGFVPNFYIKGLAGRMNTSGGDAAILEGRIFEALLNNKKTLDLAENKVGPDITEGKYKNHEAKRTGMAAFNDSNFGLGKAKGSNLVLPQDASADYDQALTKQKKASIKRAAGYPMSRLRDLAHKTINAESSKDTDYRNVPIQFSSGFIPNFARILDFDGTLGKAPEGITHKDTYHGWSASKMIPTPLVDKIRKEQQATLKAGKKIDDVVLTARSRESIPFIAAWLKEQGLSATEIIATGDKERYPEGMTTPAKKAMEMKERGLIAPGNTFHDDDKKNLTAGRRAAKEAGVKGFKTSKANYGNKGIGQMASGFVPNFAEFFKYPFTQKIRGRDRPVPPSEISGRYKEYEDQLFKGGLASLGFSDVNELNKLFNSNVEADFFARRNGNPYIIDAKAGYNDAQAGSYMKKIGPGGTFAKLKSNPKFLDFLTSKGVSVNNLREAMVFGNMGVLQENTLRKKGLMKASGFVPNFASYMDNVAGLEAGLSGEKATFHTSPFPHFRNESQPTFASAMNDHGGLSNALKDSVTGQKAAGLMAAGGVPNFAINPRSAIKTDTGPDLVGLARQKLIAQINIEIELFKKGHKTQLGLTESTKTLMDNQKVTATSQDRLNASINRQVNAHNKASAAAGAAPSFFSMNNLMGLGKDGKPLEGAAATNRQLKLGAASMGLSMAGSQITQFTAGKGGGLEKTGQAIEGVTNAASYAAMGAVFGVPGAIGGMVLGLGVAAYKMFGDTEEKAAKAAEKSKELSDSIGLLGSGMTSLKDNVIALAAASTEAEKAIIRQKIVQDKVKINANIDKIEKGYGEEPPSGTVERTLLIIRASQLSKSGGNTDKVAEAIRQLDEYSKGLAEFKTARSKKESPVPGMAAMIQASGVDTADLVSRIKEYQDLSDEEERLKKTGSAGMTIGEFQDKFIDNLRKKEASGVSLGDFINNKLGRDFQSSDYKDLRKAASSIVDIKNKESIKEKKTKFSQSNIQSYIDTKRESMLAESMEAQKKSTALDFADSAKLIGRELELSSRNALGNIDALSKAFQETANAIEKIKEDANRAKIGEEFKNLQEVQNSLNEEIKRAKESFVGVAGTEEYAKALNDIIKDSQNAAEVLLGVGNLLGPLIQKEKTGQGLSEAEKKRKEALEATSVTLRKQNATAADAEQKVKNNINLKNIELKSTQKLIEDQSELARTLSKINLSYQDLDFKIQEEIKGKNENASYALEGKRLQRDFSSERMSAMGVTLSPAAAREDAYLESSRRKVEDYQAQINTSIASSTGEKDKFKGLLGQMFEKQTLTVQGKNDIEAALKYNSDLSKFNTEKLKNISLLEANQSMMRELEIPEEIVGLEAHLSELKASQFRGRTLQENRGEFLTKLSNDTVLKNPINEKDVKDTITHISGLMPGADEETKGYLQNLKSAAETYKKEIENGKSLEEAKKRYEDEVKKSTEAYAINTRAFREETYDLEINKMKVENKLALDSSGRKIASEKYLSRFMGPDMAQGENAASKISEDQRLAIQDYDAAFNKSSTDLDRQINLLRNKAKSEYAKDDITEGDKTFKQIADLKAQQDQGKKKRELEIKKINDTASQDQDSLTETRKFDFIESQKAFNRNLAKTKRQDASEIYLSQARINSENYLSRDIRSTMGEGGSAAAKIKEDANLQIMQSRAEVALKGTDRQLQIDDLDVRRKALVGPGLDTDRADLQDKIDKLTKENVADGKMQIANEEKVNALMIQRLETLKESRTLSAITNSFFVDLANASDPIANLQRDMKNLSGSMQKGFEDAFVSFVEGTATAGDAFKGFVRGIAQEIVRMSARATANMVMSSFMQLGQAGATGLQNYFSPQREGGLIKANSGGYITGGSGYKDDLPAMLTGGEYVLKKSAVNKYGVDFLNNVNAQKFAAGGEVLENRYTLGAFSGNYGKGDSAMLAGTPTPLLGGVDLNGGSFTMGQYNMDPRLSNIALSDENNPQNRIREEMAELDRERKFAFEDYTMNKRLALEDFQKQKDDAAVGALINAAIQLAMMKVGSMIQAGSAGQAAAGDASALKADAGRTQEASDVGYNANEPTKLEARGAELRAQGVTSIKSGGFLKTFVGAAPAPQYNFGEADAGGTSMNMKQFKTYESNIKNFREYDKFMQGYNSSQFGPKASSSSASPTATNGQQFQGALRGFGSSNAGSPTITGRGPLDLLQKEQSEKANTFAYISEFFKKFGFGKSKKASGGQIFGGKDTVPALLMGGEYVVNKSAVDKYGAGFMDKLNQGRVQGFAAGGRVGQSPELGSENITGGGGASPELLMAIENLTNEIKNQKKDGAASSGITNNVEININIAENGKATGSSSASGGNNKSEGKSEDNEISKQQEENQKRKELAETLKALIIQTLLNEQRAGGILEKSR